MLLILSNEGIVKCLSNDKGLMGYNADEIIGQALTCFLSPEEGEKFRSFMSLHSGSNAVEKIVYKAIKKDGTNCLLRLTIATENNGEALAICEELSLQTSNKGKKATEQILQALLDNSFDLLALIDKEGNYLYVSESFYDNFNYQQKTNLGYKAVDIVGTNCFSYMHPDDIPRITTEFQSLFGPEKKVYSPPFRFRSASGEWHWVEAVVTNQMSNPDIEAIVVSCRDVTQQVKTEQQLKEMQLWEALVNGEEKERSRIAKDLHDGVAGMLAAAKMHLASLHTADKEMAEAGTFRQAIQLLEEAAIEVRKTSHNLMPELLLQHGLDEALRRYCCNISNGSTLVVRYDSWGDLKRYKNSFELSVYRIVQELLNNIVKHAQASEAIVQFHCDGEVLYITVEDNGIGFSEEQRQKEGMGLCNLQARVTAINGRMQLDAVAGQGVNVYLEFETAGMEKTASPIA
ncbi:MAG TPA: PAS domain S-box protein [Flavisolibacter sp.]|nr:PAS domain S-box protein [Flavisolibacter sp.]